MTVTSSVNRLASAIRGRVIAPGETDYDRERRVWNGMIDRHPQLIVKCRGTADVIAALDHAASHDIPFTVRGGGHSVAGRSVADDAMLIDLSPMQSVSVDVAAKTARVEAGATWGLVDHETQAFGLAVTGGVDSRTGVAGLTLGGGVGYLARPFGLTIDHLLSAEVVLADGRAVVANERQNPDLYWALRGGGGNFGIVTSFEYRLEEVGPEVMTVQAFHRIEEASEALRFYRDFMLDAPDQIGCYALMINTPPVEPFPEDLFGKTILAIVGCHVGDLDQAEAELSDLRDQGSPILAVVDSMPYSTLQSSFDAGAPDGGRYYWKAQYLESLSSAAIDTIVEHTETLPGPYSNVFIEAMGGAVGRVDPTATAFPHRRHPFNFGISSGWEDPEGDEAAIAWTRALHDAMAEHGSSGVYSNYVDRDESDRVEAAYGPNLERLQRVKAEYDPGNVFDQNLNVVPAS